jgi:beta-lactam-binding protein with PASTA domain
MKFKVETDTLRGLLIHASIILGLLLFILFTFFQILPFVTNKDEVVSVPDLRGMSLDEASRFVSHRHLALEVGDSAYNSELKPFTVLDQYPHPSARVKVNRKINLRLNARIPPTVSYPDLTGTHI